MTQIHPALVFLGGLVIVVLGAELLLRSATRIANLLRISPIVIGLTVVAPAPIAEGIPAHVLAAYCPNYSVSMFLADVAVLRPEKFS